MVNESEVKIYQIIGKMHSVISTSQTFGEAIKNGLKIILDSGVADYAILWLSKNDEKTTFAPFYWLCSFDVGLQKREIGKGIVGKCCQTNLPQVENNLAEGSDIRKVIVNAGAAVCVPFSTNDNSGCLEFIKKEKNGPFEEKEVDTCALLASLVEVEIKESAPKVDSVEEKENLFNVSNIKKSYKSGDTVTKVLKGINLSVYKGEFLCLLGESGCGKSTLLNIIGGMISADSGSVKFEGRELTNLSMNELTKYRRENIGYIFQSYNLMPNLTAVENVKLIAELVSHPMDEMDALGLVGLTDRANNYPSQLSGGQQQRISIARALVKKPKLILADEPTAALDYETSIEVLSVLEEVIKSGTTLIMVTHNEEIAKMANRVIRFKAGKVYETTVNVRPAEAKDLEW